MQMIIGGKKVSSSDGKVSNVFNPATQELLDTVPVATEEDIERCLDIAQDGKRLWAGTPLVERSKILLKYTSLLESHKKELATLQSKDMGKPFSQCIGEVDTAIMLFEGFVERAKHLYGETVPESQPGAEKDMLFTRREPLGVIACILPFNFPTTLFAHKVAPALVSGNAVVIKPSSDNPLVVIRLTELLLEAGVPGSVAQVITGSGSMVGKILCSSTKVNAITLTGSTEAGITVMRDSADALHRVTLELGGNDPMVIFADGDLELAVNEAYSGRIANAGQICCSPKRFIVQEPIAKDFVDKLKAKFGKIVKGDILDPRTELGCLINENAAKRVEEQVKLTIQQGAKCVYGGKRNGAFFEPTILVDVTPDMDVAKDMEIFGPVFPIIAFKTEEEALTIANNTKYGLCAGVVTSDINKGIRFMSKVEAGTVVINGNSRYRHIDHRFGGYKMSGIGREGIPCTIEEMTQVKTYVLKGILK